MSRKVYIDSIEGQLMVVLLAALEDLHDRVPSKREVEQHIRARGYLNPTSELLESYQSKAESKLMTRLAYARAAAIKQGFMKPKTQRDAWEISAQGRERVGMLKERIKAGTFDLSECPPLWSEAFKKRIG